MYYNKASNLMISAATILTFQGAVGAIILNLNINLTFLSKIIL